MASAAERYHFAAKARARAKMASLPRCESCHGYNRPGLHRTDFVDLFSSGEFLRLMGSGVVGLAAFNGATVKAYLLCPLDPEAARPATPGSAVVVCRRDQLPPGYEKIQDASTRPESGK